MWMCGRGRGWWPSSNLALQKFAEKGGTHTVVIPAKMQIAPLITLGAK